MLRAYISRIVDLKKDRRFRYVTVFRNQGQRPDKIWNTRTRSYPTPFLPRRVVYELRSYQHYYELKERCLLCDIANQELAQQTRTVEWDDQFVAFRPFASARSLRDRGFYPSTIIAPSKEDPQHLGAPKCTSVVPQA